MDNDFLSLIKTRRAVRAYTDEPVPSDVLDAILEAGTYAPTGGGRQSPVIVAITNPEYRQEIARLNAEVIGNETDPYHGAPVVVLVLADGSANTFVEDGSCVLENMMLAAHAFGLGTVWVHREREIFDGKKGKALLREWGLPETLRGVGAIALGYPAREPGRPAARKQDYIVRI
ncbi:Nitroreductase [Bifidobacterium pullorum subsp. gallinarum]|uniref:Nitroreductase n=1 Tax=Bifidobacterium pullorum subsp. gallinarum TaxID=78344 RepID=A0A087API8_9BIFI|nr:nitroreductase [Bifidobacterium pullorum]KFI60688.1 Nitroreductase [Bifidobacterium pullorum subsp. gallinarum]